jgi:hypothetical protein
LQERDYVKELKTTERGEERKILESLGMVNLICTSKEVNQQLMLTEVKLGLSNSLTKLLSLVI